MIDVAALAAPIDDLLDAFGTGQLPDDAPATALRLASVALDTAYGLGRCGLDVLSEVWEGRAGSAALDTATDVQATAQRFSQRGNEIADVVTAANADLQAGYAELLAIAQSFTNLTVAAAPTLNTPAGIAMIVAAAAEHLGRALAVVARVRGQLEVHTARMTELAIPEPMPTAPASTHAAALMNSEPLGAATRFLSGLTDSPNSSTPSMLFGGSEHGGAAPGSGPGEHRLSGRGVQVVLPDGSTAVAPNEQAATAVRAALSQQGVPYVWGGTTPGQGLDCSGLTQYAYREAGVELPRLAQEQNIGQTQVAPGDLMPGDLAVWDGHVAMVVGNGMMVEAGNPVSVSAVRTDNIGMQFHGFYRPTE